jgi:hypothetical protein
VSQLTIPPYPRGASYWNMQFICRIPGKVEPEPDRTRHFSGTSIISSGSSQSGGSTAGLASFSNFVRRVREDSGGEKIHYLQKSLPGGIILFEVGLCEPFFYAKIHALEVTRIQPKRTWKGGISYQVGPHFGSCLETSHIRCTKNNILCDPASSMSWSLWPSVRR